MKNYPTQKTMKKQIAKLATVESELVKAGKPLTNKNLMLGLEKKGLKADRSKLYYLKTKLHEGNNFVMTIAESQYSGMIQDIYDKIMLIEDKCFELAEKDWTIETRSTGEGDRNNFTKTEDNQHKPQNDFYRLALDCQNAKMKVLQGDTLNVSVAMIEQKFFKLRDENEEYIKEISRLRTIIDKKND